ncbi:amidohydrolase family protein [Acinetobacter pittii]
MSQLIDVHHHIVPANYLKALKANGIFDSAGAALNEFNENHVLEMMHDNQIDYAVTSISSPGVYFGDKNQTIDLAKECNDFSANILKKFPKKFGSFGVLPLPFIEDSLREIDLIFNTYQLNGVTLLSNYDGMYLGDPFFEPIFEALDKNKAIVFIHPTSIEPNKKINLGLPDYSLEFVFDTTRTITSLLMNHIFEKYKNIKFIVSHAGGTIPFLAWRIGRGILASRGYSQKERVSQNENIIQQLKNLYYDTALSATPQTIACLKAFCGESKILFGSDYPFAPIDVSKWSIQSLDNIDPILLEKTTNNAKKLFNLN